MSTLLIRLAGPLQSWGMNAKFDRRDTQRAPTKSAVVGLVAAALGRSRNEPLDDLNELRFGVRVDREGVLLRDYHTAKSIKSAYVTHRYYLSDAAFLAGLEGEEAMLENIAAALRCPAFPLFLGRRSCPPEGKVLLGIRQGRSLEKALREEPWLAGERVGKREALPPTLRMVMDANSTQPGAYFTRDVPLSFDQTHRKFGFRRVTEHAAAPPILKAGAIPSVDPPTDHDPMQELEE
ncbi:MAG: type I-E CRISPR-associated protein Cas5/CasD [Clostridiales bacterium]|nr:type I-E CRISPR-associated protein Cas5/CasD [Clostridiales bacterium]